MSQKLFNGRLIIDMFFVKKHHYGLYNCPSKFCYLMSETNLRVGYQVSTSVRRNVRGAEKTSIELQHIYVLASWHVIGTHMLPVENFSGFMEK